MKDVYFVIGGSGFVGRHIVTQLRARGDEVAVFDIVQRYHDVPFYSGDISNEEQVAVAIRKSGATCIIHTASPAAGLNDPALYWKVNVDGTRAVVAAAVQCGVRRLVFTSSAGVVFNGNDLIDIDERLTPPEKPLDAYNESKAKAEEAVLEANGKGGLLTVALRPAGIFGPGDRQVMAGLYQVYERNQTHFQIGDNTNLFDWTYVGNVARAHLLAADKLAQVIAEEGNSEKAALAAADSLVTLTEEEEDLISVPLPSIDLTTGKHKVPTSDAHPLGPRVSPSAQDEKSAAAWAAPPAGTQRPVVRSRFDPLCEAALQRAKEDGGNTLSVAGQAFFITNGEPTAFWDFPRAVWHLLGGPDRPQKRLIVLPRAIGMAAATASEWFGWLVGKEPTFTRYKVTYSCTTRWHNIEKARRVLGYEPEVGLAEGVKLMVDWWKSEHAVKA